MSLQSSDPGSLPCDSVNYDYMLEMSRIFKRIQWFFFINVIQNQYSGQICFFYDSNEKVNVIDDADNWLHK